jgi:hypothetical protein
MLASPNPGGLPMLVHSFRSVAVCVLLLLAAPASAQDADPMAAAARGFLESLRPELRQQANLEFDHPNRLDWHYIPRDRMGLALREMNDEERAAAHGLLSATLSGQGYLKAIAVMELDQVLREAAESQGRQADHRDPLRYYLTVFGDPASDGPWGWRFEGHHVSLNFSSVTGEVAVTPAFFGANPAQVTEGRRAGLRVLAPEEDLGRRLLASLDEAQREVAVLETETPMDILLAPGTNADSLGPPSGVAFADMTDEQQGLVGALLAVWAGNLEPGLAETQLERIHGAGMESIRFAWIGSAAPGQPHYYRLHGPTFVIEYDNAQNGANHIHTVWRDTERDFGADLLRRHLREDHGQEP